MLLNGDAAMADDGMVTGMSRRERRDVPAAVESAKAPAEVQGFRAWSKGRPFIGSAMVAVSGIEMFFSGQLDIGHLHVQLGIEGLQATIIPIALLLLGVLAMTMPDHHVFYGVLAIVVGLYSLVGVNLGGFFIGMLLSVVGGILVTAWMGGARKNAGVAVEDSP
ncbi:DUF6114 domain-containing protein [Arthrobacter sp. NPDC090010]|uniref:DUF6114 domain-containing protein n=1 Tax=Arthrobacter sp. NPDC090010 TaxID=3363942 RepID=UPI003812F400